MPLKSNFITDLAQEKRLIPLLDSYYQKHLKLYDFERVHSLEQQLQGIDLVLTHKKTGETFFVDEKAQLDYLNNDLPTFAFELFYTKNETLKQGWLFDAKKKTQMYALVTNIQKPCDNFTECNITFVNRQKLLSFLTEKGLDEDFLQKRVIEHLGFHGKMELPGLDLRKEGHIHFSSKNKAEQPVNLVFQLAFLKEIGVAKEFI
ncbi:hypothetical protein [Flagellimonas sp.]|uniref:hypothetical protein n=1 Tax=Flagellimonas sp. TaxID=2058762 RepID=UPI003F49D4A8